MSSIKSTVYRVCNYNYGKASSTVASSSYMHVCTCQPNHSYMYSDFMFSLHSDLTLPLRLQVCCKGSDQKYPSKKGWGVGMSYNIIHRLVTTQFSCAVMPPQHNRSTISGVVVVYITLKSYFCIP